MARLKIAKELLERYTYYYYTYIVDMHERCTLCGAGDGSLSHPDYTYWVSGCCSHATVAVFEQYNFLCVG